jgi:hypothetical protein
MRAKTLNTREKNPKLRLVAKRITEQSVETKPPGKIK